MKKQDRIKVSVIVPVYNVENYLRECLDRVISQTLREIEVILIDDGSNDHSLEICREYERRDKRVRVYTQKNQGAGAARNNGIHLAKGEYIAFLDADDYYYADNSLELLYRGAILNNVNICVGEFSKKVKDKFWSQDFAYYNHGYRFRGDKLIKYADYQFDFGFHRFIYNRNFLIKNGLYFPSYQHFEDPVFLVKALCKAEFFYAIDAPTYVYRQSYKPIKWTPRRVRDFLRGILDNILFAKEHGLTRLYHLSYTRLGEELYPIQPQLYFDSECYEMLRQIKKINPFFSLFDDVLKTSPPKVSVIVPVYNVERYLDEALQSITKQTLRDIEIICINDGSTDNSLKILQSYQKKDNRIKIIDKPNTGYGDSMNIGVQSARGEYIGLVEPDDYILEGMYEYLYKKAKEFDLDYIKSDYYEFFDADREKEKIYKSAVHNVLQDYNRVINPQEEMYTVCTTDVHTWAGLYKREFLLDNKIVYNTTPGASFQDSGFFFKTMCCAKRIMFVRKPFYMYRMDNENSSVYSSQRFEKMAKELRLCLEWFLQFFKDDKHLYLWCYYFIRNCLWIIDERYFGLSDKEKKMLQTQRAQSVRKLVYDVFKDQNLRRILFLPEYKNNFTASQWQRICEILEKPETRLRYYFNRLKKLKITKYFFSVEEKDSSRIGIRILGLPIIMLKMTFYRLFYRRLEKKIVFSNFFGNGYGCNPKYIAEEIIKRKLPYKLVWLLRDGVEGNLPSNIVPVRIGTPEAYKELVTATVWVDNQRKNQLLKEGICKRKGQFYIQTWHGSLGIKKLDKDFVDFGSPIIQAWMVLSKADSDMADYLLTNSEFENEILGRALWFRNEIKPFGHPRNDIFFKSETEQTNIRRKVCKILSVNPDSKIILYAPSWRDNYVYGWATLDLKRVIKTFEKKWQNKKYVLLLRLHSRVIGQNVKLFELGDNIVDASEYDDIQELLAAADYMISDYSSCLFDYVITHKPGFIFAPDRKRYEKIRGLYYPLEDTPFPIAKNNYEMEQNILNFDTKEYQRKVDSFLKGKGCFEDGHASERVVDLIESIMSKRGVSDRLEKNTQKSNQ